MMNLKIKSFMQSDNLKQFKQKLFNAKLFMTLMLFIVFASASLATNYLEALGYWSNSQNKESGIGESNIIMEFPVIVTSSSISVGSNFQPLVLDLDSNDQKEVIVTSGTTLYAFDTNLGSIYTLHQFVMPSAQSHQASSLRDRDTGKMYYVMPSNGMLYFYGMNSSGFYIHNVINVSSRNITFGTGILCTSLTDDSYGDTCMWITNNQRWAEYYTKTNTTTSFHSGGYPSNAQTPVISNNFNGVKCAYSAGGGNIRIVTPISLISFNIATGIPTVNNFFFQGNQLGGHDLLIVAGGPQAGNCIRAFKSDGSQMYSYINSELNCNSGTHLTHFIIGGKFTKNVRQICDFRHGGTGFDNKIYCYDQTNTSVNKILNGKSWSTTTGSALSIDLDGDLRNEIITPYVIINPENNAWLNFTSYNGGFMSIGDVNNDGNAEVIGSASGQTWILGATYEHGIPLPNGRIYSIIPYDKNSVCVGSSLTFHAYECGAVSEGGSGQTNCHYNETIYTDTERLLSYCTNLTGNLQNGTFHQNSPSLSCYFGNTGSYSARIFLQNNFNKNDFTLFQDFGITVINGTAGQTCNLPAPTEQTTGQAPTEIAEGTLTQDDIDYITRTMTGGGSTLVKTILVVCFTIGIIGLLAKWGIQNPIIYTGAIFALWICLALISLISWIFVIIFAFVMMLASAIYFVKGNSQGQ